MTSKNPTVTINHPTAFVIFGGTGDLANTKLFPALLDLYVAGQLPEQFVIIGLSRKDLIDVDYQKMVAASITNKDSGQDKAKINKFCEQIRYVSGSFDDSESYERVKNTLAIFDDSIGQVAHKLFYLAVPPQFYEVIFEQLHASKALALCDGQESWARLLVEKPFGRDLETAKALETKLCSLFADEQIYRIDHYLAKDAIENIVSLRFVNSVLADSWNGEAIESIHIKLLETKDVSNRGSFYDAIGTLRDVGQNHLLQIFALLTMPEADIHDPQAIRSARAHALAMIADQVPTIIHRAQYEGYQATHGVAQESTTETYFKLDFILTDDVWQGTQVTLEAGKALSQQVNEAVITFRPKNICQCATQAEPHEHRNVLRIRFSPEQHISLTMWMKQPGFTFTLREERLTLVASEVKDDASPEAYERVLFDCIAGDQTRFVSGQEVELAWQFITPILERFATLPLAIYPLGAVRPVFE
jgi:glucose-6-phosphate 1-dehydrogenase